MTMRILPALVFGIVVSGPVVGQAVNQAQSAGIVEGREGETLVIAAGSSDAVHRTYRLHNLGDGDVSIGAGASYFDLSPGNTLDYMVSADALQVTFRDAAELEFHLIAIAPAP